MKFLIGDYVRTKNGLIFKIIGGNVDNWNLDIPFDMMESFEENWLELYRYNDNGSFFDNKNIVKSSPNIIDLIEVGDFVTYKNSNFYFNIPTRVCGLFDELTLSIVKMVGDNFLNEVEITSIVTKEQFESMKYKVEE